MSTEGHVIEAVSYGFTLEDPALKGLIVIDCSCGESFTVPERGFTLTARDEARARHVAGVTGKGA